jgi:hypothetical protein
MNPERGTWRMKALSIYLSLDRDDAIDFKCKREP